MQKEQFTLDEILDEFAKQINLTFETFCNDFELQCQKTDGEEGGSVDKDLLDATPGDSNGDDKTSHCTLEQLEKLKEKVQSKISILLQDKGNWFLLCQL